MPVEPGPEVHLRSEKRPDEEFVRDEIFPDMWRETDSRYRRYWWGQLLAQKGALVEVTDKESPRLTELRRLAEEIGYRLVPVATAGEPERKV